MPRPDRAGPLGTVAKPAPSSRRADRAVEFAARNVFQYVPSAGGGVNPSFAKRANGRNFENTVRRRSPFAGGTKQAWRLGQTAQSAATKKPSTPARSQSAEHQALTPFEQTTDSGRTAPRVNVQVIIIHNRRDPLQAREQDNTHRQKSISVPGRCFENLGFRENGGGVQFPGLPPIPCRRGCAPYQNKDSKTCGLFIMLISDVNPKIQRLIGRSWFSMGAPHSASRSQWVEGLCR